VVELRTPMLELFLHFAPMGRCVFHEILPSVGYVD